MSVLENVLVGGQQQIAKACSPIFFDQRRCAPAKPR